MLVSSDLSVALDEKLLAYVAGLIDGEGSIHIACTATSDGRTRAHQLRLTVCMCSAETIEFLLSAFGGYVYKDAGKKVGYREVHTWSVHGEAAALCLGILHPYLRIKKLQAELGIKYFYDAGYPQTHGVSMPDEIRLKREWYKYCLTQLNGDKPYVSLAEFTAVKEKVG